LYSASSRIHAFNALSSLTRAAGPPSHRMQAADTDQRSGQARLPQSAVLRSPFSVTHIMGYYSFNRPRRDGRLSWLCWLTDSGRFTHKVVKRQSISLAQDRESSPARTDVLTTIPSPPQIRSQINIDHIRSNVIA